MLMKKGLTTDNSPVLVTSMTTFVNSRVECTRKCGVKNTEDTIFGRFIYKTGKCECFQFPTNTTDSGSFATETEEAIFFLTGKSLKNLSFSVSFRRMLISDKNSLRKKMAVDPGWQTEVSQFGARSAS